MKNYFLIFIFWNIFISNAQQVDTLYLHHDPVIVKKQVIVQVERKNFPSLENCFVKLGLQGGIFLKQDTDSIAKTMSPLLVPQLIVGRNFKKLSLSIGLGKSFTSMKSTFLEHKTKIVKEDSAVYDTVGMYTIILPSGVKTYYTIDTSYVNVQKKVRYDSTVSETARISYWQIPVSIAYRFDFKKNYFQPHIGIVYHFTSKSGNLTFDKASAMPKSFFSTNFGFVFGRNLNKKLAVEIGLNYQKQLTQLKSFVKNNAFLLSMMLKYSF